MLLLELLIVVLLILLNGFLAMAELALVSARRSRLQAMERAGLRGARAALALTGQLGRLLSTVQIGITLVGVLAGALSGATLAGPLATLFEQLGLPDRVSDTAAFVTVVVVITYLSLIMGELVPKRIALADPEAVAVRVARPMTLIAGMTGPLVTVLDWSSRVVLHLWGSDKTAEPRVTEEELRHLIGEAESAGVVDAAGKAMLSGVLRLGERQVRALMTPRPEVNWIDLDAPPKALQETIRRSMHSRLPVAHGSLDEVIGIVHVKSVLDLLLEGKPLDLKSLVRVAPVVHDRDDAIDVVEILRGSEVRMALVVDEYGTFEGVVTTADILVSIAGAFREAGEPEGPAVRREDGSWLLEGMMPVDEMAETIGCAIPGDRTYHTVAGFMLAHLKRLPTAGDAFRTRGWRFEVVDMDGRRIDKVLAQPVPDSPRGVR